MYFYFNLWFSSGANLFVYIETYIFPDIYPRNVFIYTALLDQFNLIFPPF